MLQWMKELEDILGTKLNKKQADHFRSILLPNIIADLNSMTKSRRDGESFNETYNIDDGSLSLVFYARKERGGLTVTGVGTP